MSMHISDLAVSLFCSNISLDTCSVTKILRHIDALLECKIGLLTAEILSLRNTRANNSKTPRTGMDIAKPASLITRQTSAYPVFRKSANRRLKHCVTRAEVPYGGWID